MKDIFNWKELKQHILTGISYFIPLVVGAGLTMAIGRVLAGQSVANLGDSGLVTGCSRPVLSVCR